MPCVTVQVGPEVRPSASVEILDTTSGRQQATVDYDVTNDGNVRTKATIEISAEGQTFTEETTLDVGQTLNFGKQIQFDNQTEKSVQICVDVVNAVEA